MNEITQEEWAVVSRRARNQCPREAEAKGKLRKRRPVKEGLSQVA